MTSNSMMHDNVFCGDGDVGDESDDLPPALPIKTRQRSTRRDRHATQYDNVEETDNFPKWVNLWPCPTVTKYIYALINFLIF